MPVRFGVNPRIVESFQPVHETILSGGGIIQRSELEANHVLGVIESMRLAIHGRELQWLVETEDTGDRDLRRIAVAGQRTGQESIEAVYPTEEQLSIASSITCGQVEFVALQAVARIVILKF